MDQCVEIRDENMREGFHGRHSAWSSDSNGEFGVKSLDESRYSGD